MALTILGIGGSLREGSRSLAALQLTLRGSRLSGASSVLFDLRRYPLPLYDDRPDLESYGANVQVLLREVRRAHGVILCTPVYHGTPSGALKNTLDYLELLAGDQPPWLHGKVVGLISVAGGRASDNAINSLAYACRALHAWTLPLTVALPGSAFVAGKLHDAELRQRVLRLGQEVAEHARLLAACATQHAGYAAIPASL